MADKDFKVKNGLDMSTPLPVTMGGTGQTSTSNTLNSLLPSQPGNSAKVLQTDGSNVSWVTLPSAYQRGDSNSRPASPTVGDIYYNTSYGYFEQYASSGWYPIAAIPGIPTAVVATDQGSGRSYNNGSASVAVTGNTSAGYPSSFTVTPTPSTSPSTFSGTSPIIVTGLQSETSYTYTAIATSPYGTSSASSASTAVTATTVPDAPTIGTGTVATGQSYTGSANVSVSFTAGATGGSSITGYTVTSSSGATATGSSSPISISDIVGTARTYTVNATNANGTSLASSATSSVTPSSVPQAPTIGTASGGTGTVSVTFTANSTGGSSITGYTVTSSSGATGTGASSPITVTETVAGTYTYTVTATNANGNSSASSASNSNVTTLPDPSWWGTFSSSINSAEAWDLTPYVSPTTGTVAVKYDQKRGNNGNLYVGMVSASPPALKYATKYLSSNAWYKQVQDLLIDDSNNAYFVLTSNNAAGTYSSGVFKLNSNATMGGGLVFSGNTNLFTFTPGAAGYHSGNGILRNGFIYTKGAGSVVFKIPTSLGGITWQKTLTNIGNIFSVGVDDSGNVYVVGDANIIVKLNSSGSIVWQKAFTSSGATFTDAITSKNGTSYIQGYTNSGAQTIILKIDSNGAYQWTKSIPYATGWYPRAVLTDKNDSVYIVHNTTYEKVKLASDGSFQWNRSFTPASGLSIDSTCAVDDNGAVYINARNSTTYQAYFAKFPGDGSKTGTYTIGTWSVGSTKTITGITGTVSDTTSISISDSAYTTSSGYPTGIALDTYNYTISNFGYTSL